MDGGDDHLIVLKKCKFFFNNRGAFYQYGSFINIFTTVNNSCTCFAVIPVAKTGCLACIMLNHYLVTVTYQNAYSIRSQCNTVLLEGNFLRNSYMELRSFWFNIKRFF